MRLEVKKAPGIARDWCVDENISCMI